MKRKNVLVACEYTQIVTQQFRSMGIRAHSCDVLPTLGKPYYHFQHDVIPLLTLKWDAVIAFPPCTHLASSGARWFEQKRKDGRQQQGIDFFMKFVENTKHIPFVAIENPIGIMSTQYRKPDQIIQPWMFGEPYSKSTCLWLKNLPELKATEIVDKGEHVVHNNNKKYPKWMLDKKARDKTFIGIAEAMSKQWGEIINDS